MVLLDLNMPVMDGRETLRRIKNDPRFKDIPVVVFTTSSLKEDRKECKRLGADAFISKPSSFQGMVNAIQEVVAKWFPAL